MKHTRKPYGWINYRDLTNEMQVTLQALGIDPSDCHENWSPWICITNNPYYDNLSLVLFTYDDLTSTSYVDVAPPDVEDFSLGTIIDTSFSIDFIDPYITETPSRMQAYIHPEDAA